MIPLHQLVVTEEEYAQRRAKRTRAAAQFARSEDSHDDIIVGSLSSIPRWRYASALDAKARNPGCARTEEALQELLESTKEIIGGKTFLCEYLINRDASDAVFRLAFYSSLMRAALYISEKNDKVPLRSIRWP